MECDANILIHANHTNARNEIRIISMHSYIGIALIYFLFAICASATTNLR